MNLIYNKCDVKQHNFITIPSNYFFKSNGLAITGKNLTNSNIYVIGNTNKNSILCENFGEKFTKNQNQRFIYYICNGNLININILIINTKFIPTHFIII